MAKITIDGPNKIMDVNTEETEIDVRVDIYSEWKNWMLLSDNAKFFQAMRNVGGEDLPGGENLGSTFFMMNGWKIRIDHSVNFTGNLWSEDGSAPIIAQEGSVLATSIISTLVEKPDLGLTNAQVFV
jgi:hypothetical protein